ncbi:gluconolactonase [Alteromonas sediminis]|uniref:Gluconolactonase n=1 Tax=Alteromonas sediminis TaxID=2259342 RepID=A0A3N5ZAT2_9ALTE|nr:SMP-30/gluconolactonase/LRE family protein [Alteromonas sediminis]RPJ66668.1 gluconolactonase [Alteromonas sediminis]
MDLSLLFIRTILLAAALNIGSVFADACESNLLPVASHASPHLISKDFKFLEGPTWSQVHQRFFFSEMDFSKPQNSGPSARVFALDLPNTTSIFIHESGSNGLVATAQALYAATHNSQSLSKFSWETKEKTIIADRINGKTFNSPNDLTVHSSGAIFFTDPDWQLGPRPSETGITGVYRVDPKTHAVKLIDKTLNKPNGIVISRYERFLFVGDLDGNISQYALNKVGDVEEKIGVFAQVDVPDGMAVDCAGNLYVTSHTNGEIQIFSEQGVLLQRLPVAPGTTNVAFGGKDLKTLLITSGEGLFVLPVQIPGLLH